MGLIPNVQVWCRRTIKVYTGTQGYGSRDITVSKPKWTKIG